MNLINNPDFNFSTIASLILMITIFASLWYLKNLFYKNDMKGVIPFFEALWDFFLKPCTQVETDWYKKYGKFYKVNCGNGKFLFTIGEPKYIKQILVKDFHIFNNRFPQLKNMHEILQKNLFMAKYEHWKRYRSFTSPAFTSGKIKKMYSLIDQCLEYCIENLETHVLGKKEVNLKDVFGCFTMDVIAKTAFGIDINAKKDKNNPFVLNANKIIAGEQRLKKFITLFIFPTFLSKLLGFSNESSSRSFFLDVSRHLIKKKRESNERKNDFLQLLIDAQHSGNTNEIDKSESHYVHQGEEEIKAERQALNTNFSKKKLDDDEIVAQMYLFFLAGFEATSTTLSFCSYELAVNQDIQDKLYNEIKSNADQNGDIDCDKLVKLSYLDAVISETLRKYPPGLHLERQANQDYKIPEVNIIVPKDNSVKIPVYAIHHCEEFYMNPDKFDPERFMPENCHLIHPYTYLPFGAGPRNCIGMRFALLGAKLALFEILQKFKFVKCSKTDVPVKMMYRRFLIVASKRLIVGIERR